MGHLWTWTFLWGVDLSGSPQGTGGVRALLSLVDAGGSTRHYPSYDGNGNIVAWTSSGATAPSCLREYDAFGNVVVEQGAPPCGFGFSTKIEDPESGLVYYGYRYLKTLDGRWISKDPIGEEGGANLYGSIGNEGLGRIDFIGMTDYSMWTGIHSTSDYVRGAGVNNGNSLKLPGYDGPRPEAIPLEPVDSLAESHSGEARPEWGVKTVTDQSWARFFNGS